MLLASNFESCCMRLRCICGAPLVVMTQELLSLEKNTLEEWKKKATEEGWPLRWFPQLDGHAWVHGRFFKFVFNLKVLSLMMHRHR